VYVSVDVNNTAYEKSMMLWMAQETAQLGSILQLTVMPSVAVERVPDKLLYAMAETFKEINDKYKVPLMVRYCHEMNGKLRGMDNHLRSFFDHNSSALGNWLTTYGMRPKQMIASFRKLSTYVKQLTNMTGMVISFKPTSK
jgi:hypothetical protein